MKPLLLAALLPLALAGCTAYSAPPDVTPFRSPADPSQGIRRTADPNVIGDYVHREPVDPRPWRNPSGAAPAGSVPR